MSQIVKCPKCHASVSITPDQAGKRLQCPSCVQQFLAPAAATGAAGATAEDDDWLTLSDEPPARPAASQPATSENPLAPKTNVDLPEDSPYRLAPLDAVDDVEVIDEQDILAEASGANEVSGASFGSGATLDDNLFDDLPPIDAGLGGAAITAAEAAAANDGDREFRVTCTGCGSILYAKVKQVGSNIRCSDCFTQVAVPEAPERTEAPQPTSSAGGMALVEPQTADKPADPYLKSAEQLLRDAEAEPEEREFRPAYEVPDTLGWLRTVFGVLADPGVIFHILALSVFIAIPVALVVAVPIFAIGTVPIALIGITLTASCGFAILTSVTNGHERVEDWPAMDPGSWFDALFVVVAAIGMAVGPSYMLAVLIGAGPLITVGFVMFVVYVTLPFILLSMLDMQSVAAPFSPDVAKSVTKCQEDWGVFYFSAGVLFTGLFAYFVFIQPTPIMVGIGVVLSIITIFLYFAMMGRLAIAIGEVAGLAGLDEPKSNEKEAAENET